MSTTYITIGASGAGKSRWVSQNSTGNDTVICPDDIRKKITGSVSDQSQNARVFEIAYDWLDAALSADNAASADIFWSATNLNIKGLKDLIERCRSSNVKLVWLEDSRNWELCQSRVANDIAEGVDRSATSDVVIDTRDGRHIPLIQSMSERYIELFSHKEELERLGAISIVVAPAC